MVRRAIGTGYGNGVRVVRPAPSCGGEDDSRSLDAGVLRRRLGIQPKRQQCDDRVVPIPVSDAASLAGVAGRADGATLVLMGNTKTRRRTAGRPSEDCPVIRGGPDVTC